MKKTLLALAFVLAFQPSCRKAALEEPQDPLAGTRLVTVRYPADTWDCVPGYIYDDEDHGTCTWTSPDMDDLIPYYSRAEITRVFVKQKDGFLQEAFLLNGQISLDTNYRYSSPPVMPRKVSVIWPRPGPATSPNADSVIISIRY